MSKAEDLARQKALEKFPILFGERMGYDKTNLQQERRNAFEKGYHQAEKDLELTWTDMECIIKHYQDIMAKKSRVFVRVEDYQDLLKRFNKERKEK